MKYVIAGIAKAPVNTRLTQANKGDILFLASSGGYWTPNISLAATYCARENATGALLSQVRSVPNKFSGLKKHCVLPLAYAKRLK